MSYEWLRNKKAGKMKKKKMIKILAGVILGGTVGFLYYRFVGCKTGACFITRNPYISTIYWALLGGLVANIL